MGIELALDVFGLSQEDFTEELVKKRFRELAKKYHPDLKKSWREKYKATEDFILLKEARDLLLLALKNGECIAVNEKRVASEEEKTHQQFTTNKKSKNERPAYYGMSPREIYEINNPSWLDRVMDNVLFELVGAILIMGGGIWLIFSCWPWIGVLWIKNKFFASPIERNDESFLSVGNLLMFWVTSLGTLYLLFLRKSGIVSPSFYYAGTMMSLFFLMLVLTEFVGLVRYRLFVKKHGLPPMEQL